MKHVFAGLSALFVLVSLGAAFWVAQGLMTQGVSTESWLMALAAAALSAPAATVCSWLTYRQDTQVVTVSRFQDADAQTDAADEAAETHVGQHAEVVAALADVPADALPERALRQLCNHLKASQGAFYRLSQEGYEMTATYAFLTPEQRTVRYEQGEGLIGQVAKAQEALHVRNVPADYLTILSGLGQASPAEVYICPVVHEGTTVAVVELATFRALSAADTQTVDAVADAIAARCAPAAVPVEA